MPRLTDCALIRERKAAKEKRQSKLKPAAHSGGGNRGANKMALTTDGKLDRLLSEIVALRVEIGHANDALRRQETKLDKIESQIAELGEDITLQLDRLRS